MTKQNSLILIVDDDQDIANMLKEFFTQRGYEAHAAYWGEDGVKACFELHPSLIILDIKMPDIDGFEVAQRIRANRRTADTPIIFLTEHKELKIQGLEMEAEDFIKKPFDIYEIELRVRNILMRTRRAPLDNPITGLPTGKLVDEKLSGILEGENQALLVLSLKNLDKFRDVYGFVASDDLLRAVTLMIKDIIEKGRSPKDFLGHFTANDFLILTSPAALAYYRERIPERLEKSFEYFYRDQDRESDIFRGKHLAVKLNELVLDWEKFSDLQQLVQKLEQICQE